LRGTRGCDLNKNFEGSALDLLKGWLRDLSTKQLYLVPIRNKVLSEEVAYEGDYDFLCNPQKLSEILSLLHESCIKEGIPYLIDRRKPRKTRITLHDPKTDRQIILELWEALDIKERGRAPWIPWSVIEPLLIRGEEGVRLDPRLESLYYLSHLKSKKKEINKPEVLYRLDYYRKLSRSWPEIEDLYEKLHSKTVDLQEAGHRANDLLCRFGWLESRSRMTTRLRVIWERGIAEWARIRSQWICRLGIVALVGPDGVGKTTLQKSLSSQFGGNAYRFKRLYRRSILYKAIYLWARDLEKEKKNMTDDRLGRQLFCIARLRYPFLLCSALIRKKPLYVDRYYYDLLFEGLRFREQTPRLRSNALELAQKIPRACMVVQLDAPNEAILARKKELTEAGIELYRHTIFFLAFKRPPLRYAYVRTDLPISSTLALLGEGPCRC